jgi:hypothetical protein
MLQCRDRSCPCNIVCYISICKMQEVHKDMSWGQHSHFPHTCHTPCLSHSPWFGHPYNVCCRVQIMKLLIMQFSPFSATSSLLGPNIFLSTPFLNTPAYVLLLMSGTKFCTFILCFFLLSLSQNLLQSPIPHHPFHTFHNFSTIGSLFLPQGWAIGFNLGPS